MKINYGMIIAGILVVGAIYLAAIDKAGWGWCLLVAVIIASDSQGNENG